MAKAKKSPTVTLASLGCKLNQAEMQEMASQLAQTGYRIVDATEKADIYILNTCTVTHIADRKSRHLLRLARRRNPSARLIAVGCYAQRAPEELKGIDGVELVPGNERKTELIKLLQDSDRLDHTSRAEATRQHDSLRRSRAFLKIQDGCQSFCTYCIVPYVRPHQESRLAGEIIDRIKEKTAGGFKEVVLTGTEIGEYNDGGFDLAALTERILNETNVTRLRLSSLQPHNITSGLIALWRDTRLCPHFHLSLQSGSDTVLERMNRRYTTADYRRAVKTIRETIPEAAVTTDVIAGFPGETEGEFGESLEFCRQMRFARIHVFPFSSRPGTAAATMPGQVPDAVKKERGKILRALAGEAARDYRERYLGEKAEALWEQCAKGIWTGLTGNYIRVYTKSSEDLTDKLERVTLVKLYRDGVWGEIESRVC